MRKPLFGVILSGCGVADGSEIHEAVLTLLAIEKQGGTYQIFAPDMQQRKVVNHLNQNIIPEERRNVLTESARIARGNIKPLHQIEIEQIDALILPGGSGITDRK